MAKQFENQLIQLGFNLEDVSETQDYIICRHILKDCFVYKQDCSCCCVDLSPVTDFSRFFNKPYCEVKSKDLIWFKIATCQECLDDYLTCLFCGGHYNNIRIFNSSEEVTNKYNMNHNNFNPEELVYPDWEE